MALRLTPMLPRIDYIKQARIKLRLTQRELATLAGISTSMINQIESGRCKPSYETAKRIFEVLGSHEGKAAMKAREICNMKLISIQKNEPLQIASGARQTQRPARAARPLRTPRLPADERR